MGDDPEIGARRGERVHVDHVVRYLELLGVESSAQMRDEVRRVLLSTEEVLRSGNPQRSDFHDGQAWKNVHIEHYFIEDWPETAIEVKGPWWFRQIPVTPITSESD